jgi:two-component system chemotaxis sensor kinase CheA
LRSADLLSDLVANAKGGPAVDPNRAVILQGELQASLGGGTSPVAAAEAAEAAEADEFGFVPQQVVLFPIEATKQASPAPGWTITFKPHDSLYAKANDAVVLLRELERLGRCDIALDLSTLPMLDKLEVEKSYLAWSIELAGECSESDVREVFDFVDGDCDLQVTAGSAQADVDVRVGADIEDHAPSPIPATEAFLAVTAPPTAPPSAPSAGSDAAKSASGPAATIRVDLERIDRLINLVGELVINQAMLSQRAAESGFSQTSTVGAGLDELEQLTREIQDSVMAIRAQPVKSVFQRMPRLVREIAAITGKQVRLVTEGETTEVDKTVIEQLSDPLTHMIRNAIDHGLESPERRAAAGKNPEGCVRLAAVHRSGRIVIEIGDDGAGINRERVRQIAIDKGLLDPEAVLTDEELDNLIFLPGFSTAKEVSNISGRGVGMDVVKRSIQALGGRISIASQPGRGSTFTLSLPLTLAVLDGMVVCAGSQTLIAPLTTILETLRPKPSEVRSIGPHARVVAIRDTHVPLIDLGVLLGARATPIDASAGVCLLVESDIGGRAALLVDSIQGQRQVVIKSLEANYQKVDLIAAATILGDGRVALILDVDAVVESGRRDSSRTLQSQQLQLAS